MTTGPGFSSTQLHLGVLAATRGNLSARSEQIRPDQSQIDFSAIQLFLSPDYNAQFAHMLSQPSHWWRGNNTRRWLVGRVLTEPLIGRQDMTRALVGSFIKVRHYWVIFHRVQWSVVNKMGSSIGLELLEVTSKYLSRDRMLSLALYLHQFDWYCRKGQ